MKEVYEFIECCRCKMMLMVDSKDDDKKMLDLGWLRRPNGSILCVGCVKSWWQEGD